MSTTIGFRRRVAKQLQRQADLTPETLIVALDLGKRQHAVWVTDPTRVPLATWTMPNTPAGFTDLLRQTADLSAQSGHRHVLFAMEPTSYFWKLAAQQLTDHGARYRLVHPLSVRRARDERRYTWAKGDRIDAELIASLVAQGTWLDKQLEQGPWATWESLALARVQLVQQRADTRRELHALVALVFPTYPYLPHCVTSPGSLAILGACPTPAQIQCLPAHEFVHRIRTHYRAARFSPRRTLRVYEAAQRSWGLRAGARAASVRIRGAVARYTLITQQIREMERHLIRFYRASGAHTLLDTIPGLRAPMASTLLGLIGPVQRYDRSRCLIRLAGAEPTENASGTSQGKTPISHRGRGYLRLAAYQAAMALIRHNPEFRARYQWLTTRPQHPLPLVAARLAVADKLLRTIYTMLITRRSYDPSVARGEGREQRA